jgi:hypothetical protein
MVPRTGQQRFWVAKSAEVEAFEARQKPIADDDDWRQRDHRPGRFAVTGSFIVLSASDATSEREPALGALAEPDPFYH